MTDEEREELKRVLEKWKADNSLGARVKITQRKKPRDDDKAAPGK